MGAKDAEVLTLVCPHCGNRFTHPFVMFLAWMIGISFVVGVIASFQDHPATSQPSLKPVAASIQQQPKKDEAAFVIQHCGRPDREFLEQAPGTPIRHLVYRRYNTELFFMRDPGTPWRLGNAFVPNRDEDMTMEEANRRMPCAKGQLHSLLDSN